VKADRKRLKAEKYDLLNQMKQLYSTLEDKEKELRDFIRNYEQVKGNAFSLKMPENIIISFGSEINISFCYRSKTFQF
jgi:hypothetical protein